MPESQSEQLIASLIGQFFQQVPASLEHLVYYLLSSSQSCPLSYLFQFILSLFGLVKVLVFALTVAWFPSLLCCLWSSNQSSICLSHLEELQALFSYSFPYLVPKLYLLSFNLLTLASMGSSKPPLYANTEPWLPWAFPFTRRLPSRPAPRFSLNRQSHLHTAN